VSDTLRDPALVLLSIVVVSALVLISQRIARSGGISPAARRTFLHAAVGAWTVFVTPLFRHLAWALVAPVLFGILNATGRARRLMPGLADSRREARGLWTFPLAVALTYILFWEDPPRRAILAGLTVLAFADPAAALVGRRWGQRRLRFGGNRTLEGTLAFFVVAAIGVGVIAAGSGGGSYPWRLGVGCGVAGALAEALTPPTWDNLTVPLVVTAGYQLLGGT
jgi:dolichol kinase